MFRKKLIRLWQKSAVAPSIKMRRLQFIDNLVGGKLLEKKPRKILEIGCADGKDFVRLMLSDKEADIHGIDIQDYGLRGDNFTMHVGDAEQLPFTDDYFDVAISIGVLEHIQPVEKLCRLIKEIDRVAKVSCTLVPSVGTILEPHLGELFWQLKGHNKKKSYSALNYYSDEAWLQFEGFKGYQTKRLWYLPPVISNLAIYKG